MLPPAVRDGNDDNGNDNDNDDNVDDDGNDDNNDDGASSWLSSLSSERAQEGHHGPSSAPRRRRRYVAASRPWAPTGWLLLPPPLPPPPPPPLPHLLSPLARLVARCRHVGPVFPFLIKSVSFARLLASSPLLQRRGEEFSLEACRSSLFISLVFTTAARERRRRQRSSLYPYPFKDACWPLTACCTPDRLSD
eukprot:GHVU01024061.1.p1 GENE.GHVU01024061.1~~GHVU01024061.1.p1  ORF type:complete len:193 (+),score=32.99 GHVU01024061.1:639-1217(+)